MKLIGFNVAVSPYVDIVYRNIKIASNFWKQFVILHCVTVKMPLREEVSRLPYKFTHEFTRVSHANGTCKSTR